MKVAIIGAGLSGLSCAYTLKKAGITPTLFEQNTSLGNILNYPMVTLNIFDPFYETPMDYFKKNYGLKIKPLRPLKKLVMISPHKTTTVSGHLGYIFKRNEEQNSLDHQIYNQTNIPILFNTHKELKKIKNDYDHIVCASGNTCIPKELKIFHPTLKTHVRIATLTGNFKQDTLYMWVDTNFFKQGYAYFVPFNSHKGCLILTLNHISDYEFNHYWSNFLDTKPLDFKILETRDAIYDLGLIQTPHIKNYYLVGNCGGYVDEFLGFGGMNAIESGILAGKCIVDGLDYNQIMDPTFYYRNKLYLLRKTMNTFNNADFDRLITFLGLPFIKQWIYHNSYFKIINSSFLQKSCEHIIKNREPL